MRSLKAKHLYWDRAMKLFSAVDVEVFLNTLKTASEDYELMDHTHKDVIARMLLLNMIVEEGKVSSVTLNPPFNEMIKHPLILDGGQWACELERLRGYHREHGYIGRKYVEIIHEFNPSYAPRTPLELARLSRSFPSLTTR